MTTIASFGVGCPESPSSASNAILFLRGSRAQRVRSRQIHHVELDGLLTDGIQPKGANSAIDGDAGIVADPGGLTGQSVEESRLSRVGIADDDDTLAKGRSCRVDGGPVGDSGCLHGVLPAQ
ncbi:MAG: hypothetical protein QM784_12560 [Polyangiaceae bacterium]